MVNVVVAPDEEAFEAESSPDSFGERDIRCALMDVRWGKSTSIYREKDLSAALNQRSFDQRSASSRSEAQ